MTKSRFKEIYETNRHDMFQLCYLVFIESGGQKIDRGTFDSLFNMYLLTNGGMNVVITNLKKKYEIN